MTQATKEVLTKVGLWWLLVMIPIAGFYYLTGELMFNSIADTNKGKVLLLITISGISKAIMDTLTHHYSKSIFARWDPLFWNPVLSWKNKYSDAIKLIRKKWFGFVPVPVLFSDGWHLSQSIFLNCLLLSVVLYEPMTPYKLFDFIILGAWFRIYFQCFYGYLFIKHN